MTRQRIGTGISRSTFLLGGGAALASATGLGALAPAASANEVIPDGDFAYLRLLCASELLAVDFYGRATEAGALRRPASVVARRIRADESDHYTYLADLMTVAGQTPPTAGDIDFSYPAGTFASRRSMLSFAKELEHMLTGAYIDALKHVQTPKYRERMALILAGESQHHSAIAGLLGEPPIGKPAAAVRMAAMSNYLDRFES